VRIIERLAPAATIALQRVQAAHPAILDDESRSGQSAQPISRQRGAHRTSDPARGN
jgi:hypothetical protein